MTAWTLRVEHYEDNTQKWIVSDGEDKEYSVHIKSEGLSGLNIIVCLHTLLNEIEKRELGYTQAEKMEEFTKELLKRAFGTDVDACAAFVAGFGR